MDMKDLVGYLFSPNNKYLLHVKVLFLSVKVSLDKHENMVYLDIRAYWSFYHPGLKNQQKCKSRICCFNIYFLCKLNPFLHLSKLHAKHIHIYFIRYEIYIYKHINIPFLSSSLKILVLAGLKTFSRNKIYFDILFLIAYL